MKITKTIKGHTFEAEFRVVQGFSSGSPAAKIQFKLDFEDRWFNADRLLEDQKAVRFIMPRTIFGAKVGGLSLPPEDFAALAAEVEAINAAIRAEQAAHAEAIRTGTLPITVSWENGEYLSGYAVYDADASRELVRLGAARIVSGWGTLVDDTVVKALGTSFTVPDVEAYTAPARKAAQQAERQALAAQEAALKQAQEAAARTGTPVVLARWVEDCDGTVVECSTDAYARLMMPDGSTRVERVHTF